MSRASALVPARIDSPSRPAIEGFFRESNPGHPRHRHPGHGPALALGAQAALFRLPGDFVIDRPGFKFFFPLTTMLIVSLVDFGAGVAVQAIGRARCCRGWLGRGA